MALFGFVIGLAWWTNPLICFYLFPLAPVLAWQLRRTIRTVYPPAVNDRYPPYTKLVEQADSPAYIIMQTRSSGFEEMLGTMNIRGYEKEELAPFVLFYDLYRDR